MSRQCNPTWEYRRKPTEWADGWAIVGDAAAFASRFNTIVPGAYRTVTTDDIRNMARCSLIGRSGFYHREDVEMVRGILQYEQLRRRDEAARGGGVAPDAVGAQRR